MQQFFFGFSHVFVQYLYHYHPPLHYTSQHIPFRPARLPRLTDWRKQENVRARGRGILVCQTPHLGKIIGIDFMGHTRVCISHYGKMCEVQILNSTYI